MPFSASKRVIPPPVELAPIIATCGRPRESDADDNGESSSSASQRRAMNGSNKSPPSFLGEQPMVSVVVKNCQRSIQTIPIHKNFICYYSLYFEAALNNNFVEGQTQEVQLDDVDHEVFNLFVTWIYGQKIRSSESEKLDINIILNLWLLADRLLVPKLQNEAMNYLFSQNCDPKTMGTNTINSAYALTLKGSPLRLYIAEFSCTALSPDRAIISDELPRELLEDIIACLLKKNT
ncbi:hypothetical protein G7Y89_g10347 [Cudoniella acicularis]|uniref:BTB domain-containing protein n=1 Tax=Cudoniella acicularis TaxID=354080 RepID=A0A8H4RE18_9HELO|nr:hypothetical protein G7Y89_g10347 [Cudoniella acicularis]